MNIGHFEGRHVSAYCTKETKAEEELRLRFDLCNTDGYMENIAKRLGIDPSFLEKK